jgi:hypothetical protein
MNRRDFLTRLLGLPVVVSTALITEIEVTGHELFQLSVG